MADDKFTVGDNVVVTYNEEPDGWDQVVKGIVVEVCVPMMENLADLCNKESGLEGGGVEQDPRHPDETKPKDASPGYRAGLDGGRPLSWHDYRATCITATYPAMHDNAVNNRLVSNFHKVEGE